VNESKTCLQCGTSVASSEDPCPRCILLRARESSTGPKLGPQFLDDLPLPAETLVIAGKYRVLETIGRGGMGVVYKVKQESLNRVVAVKMLLGGAHASDEYKRRFLQEAKAAAALHHPNIVSIHEWGEEAGQPFFSMDFVDGKNLHDLAGHRPLESKRACEYVRTVALAVHYAHQKAIIHRDLKPHNIMVDLDDQPRVTDFGLAKQLSTTPVGEKSTSAVAGTVAQITETLPDDTESLTLTGQMLGTPNYMAPEQVYSRRAELGPAIDVYALGGILYFLLTGRPPFEAATIPEVIDQVARADPIAPRLLNPALHKDLETICLRCLEKQPRRRYSTAHDVAEELNRFLRHEPIQARPISNFHRFARWCGRNRGLAAALFAVLILLSAVALLSSIAAVRIDAARGDERAQHAQAETNRIRAEQLTLQTQEANKQLATVLEASEIQRAEELFAAGEAPEALACLARVVRKNPVNELAAMRLLSALTYGSFPLPVCEPLPHPGAILRDVEFSPDGRTLVTVAEAGHRATLWESETGRHIADLPLQDWGRSAKYDVAGNRIVTASLNGTANIWDARTGEHLGPELRHADGVNYAEFSPDGKSIVTASRDKSGQVWDAATGERRGAILRHKENVEIARFSPDSRFVATGGFDGTAQLWDATTGEAVGKPLRHGSWVIHLQFSPDGKVLATASSDHTACLWDCQTGSRLLLPFRHEDAVERIAFSPDGNTVATGCWDWRGRLWDRWGTSPTPVLLGHRQPVWECAFAPNGRRVVTASGDHTARVWEPASGTPVMAPMNHRQQIHAARFDPLGMKVATISMDEQAQVWDVRDGRAIPEEFYHDGEVLSAFFLSPSDRLVTISANNTVRVIERKTGQTTSRLQLSRIARILRLSPHGNLVAVASGKTTVQVWDLLSEKLKGQPMEQPSPVECIEFSEDGSMLATGCQDGTVRIWDTATTTEKAPPFIHEGEVTRLRIRGGLMAAAASRRTVSLWNLERHQRLLSTEGSAAMSKMEVSGLDISPDGKSLLVACHDSTAQIWDIPSASPRGAPLQHEARVMAAWFSPDGARIVTVPDENTAWLWDARTLKVVADVMKHSQSNPGPTKAPLRSLTLRSARFSRDGKKLVTASADGTARVWDAATGLPLSEPFQHPASVNGATFNEGGDTVLTASADGIVRGWALFSVTNATPAWLPELAEAVAGRSLNDRNIGEDVARKEFFRLKAQLTSQNDNDLYSVCARWLLADRSVRPISPFSQITLPEFTGRLIAQNTGPTLERAIDLSLTNGLAYARLAVQRLNALPNSAHARAEADFFSRYALKLAPDNEEAREIRQRIIERLRIP